MSTEIGTSDLLLRLLSASALRAEVLANNISNQGTPGFRREDVRFEDLLRERLESGGDLDGLEPVVEPDFVTPVRADGNNVVQELEHSAMRENRMLYETYALMLQGGLELLRSAVESGN